MSKKETRAIEDVQTSDDFHATIRAEALRLGDEIAVINETVRCVYWMAHAALARCSFDTTIEAARGARKLGELAEALAAIETARCALATVRMQTR